ncbi:MAG: hypothetical protein A2499_03640 [Stygiobacter sp. RIFOXYC12_FULL_38_8]|nr:hypothetical protein [Bacteroidota bacterium]OGV13274.1 MAG: hypothetical protein A2440_13180 [Stygiobacter sp. RIFOXYC2_FULL_38_25]OGV30227.1 MAG: hypothetical protein A2499_03640 [Stygiobacter sp. RIFOXYC12_FULL_38_8]OGV83320.1 MAG: hypothetical protein A2X65_16735 [Stygiobacter sp. GWF2_38_21]
MKVDIYDIKRKLILGIPLNSWGSYEAIWDMLHDIRRLKYIRRSQIASIDKRYNKTCSEKKINRLLELGLIKKTDNEILISTEYSLELLKQLNYNTSILPKNIKGEGSINELNNTEVFIQALKLPDFLALLYPNFEYIRPDALLVRGVKEKYYLEFLEVEASKSNWGNWLEEKRINYFKLAQEKRPFSYWVSQCKLLDLPVPDINKFKFSVCIIGKIKYNFEEWFNFMEKLNENI